MTVELPTLDEPPFPTCRHGPSVAAVSASTAIAEPVADALARVSTLQLDWIVNPSVREFGGRALVGVHAAVRRHLWG